MAYTKEEIEYAKEKIVVRLAEGMSLKKILESDKKLPSRPIVYEWLNPDHKKFDKVFLNNYLRARADSADNDFDYVQEIADLTLLGKYDANAARVAINAYIWTSSKKNPKKYGDKLSMDINQDDIKPIETKRRDKKD